MQKNIMIVLAGVSLMIGMSCKSATQTDNKTTATNDSIPLKPTIHNGFTRIDFDATGMINKMVYATDSNFTKQKIYPCAECYLRTEVAEALKTANAIAQSKNLRLVIFDCYRPLSIQKKMYEIVNNPRYVAPPTKASKHNRGCAVDVSLADKEGNLLAMGTGFDDFSEKAKFDYANISPEEKENRELLRSIMIASDFLPYNNEWWHFNYKNTDYDVADFIWDCP